MKYVYYEWLILGYWSLRTSLDRPTVKSPEGAKHRITQIQELPPEHQDLPLNELITLYPLRGDLTS